MLTQCLVGIGLIETALEKILVTMGRFSNMGYLQSVLEAQACCDNFSECRNSMVAALENLLKSRNQVPHQTSSIPHTHDVVFLVLFTKMGRRY